MQYDFISGESSDDYEEVKFFTIGDLIELCKSNPTCKFRFAEAHATVGDLISWRGSYDLPCITPLWYKDFQTGEVIAGRLHKQLHEEHSGYKGGKYKYLERDEFYVADSGSAQEYKVVGYTRENGVVTLLTKLDPY